MMKGLVFCFLAGASAVGDVLELTRSNFDSVITEHPNILVEFYAPWCGHCKSLEPEYKKAAKLIEGVTLAKVDATKEGELAEKYGVEGFPTIIFFKDGDRLEEYEGGRKAENIIEWCEERTGEPHHTVTEEALEESMKSAFKAQKAAIVLYAPSDSKELETFVQVAARNRGFGMYFYVAKTGPSVVRVSHKDEGVTGSMEGNIHDEAEIISFLRKERFPLFGRIDTSNYESYSGPQVSPFSLVWFCFDSKTAETEIQQAGEAVREAARKLRGDYYFVHIDTQEFDEHAEKYLGCASFPSMVVQTDLQGKASRFVHKMDVGNFSVQEIEVDKGSVQAFLRGQPAPAENNGPVRDVVTSTFEAEVFRADKDVLLEIYAPWCGHCKKLGPIYEQLGRMVKAQEASNNLVIARLEGTENESPFDDFQWEGFPTIFYVSAGSRKPAVVRVGRTLKDLVGYMKAHSKFPSVKKLEVLSGPLDFEELRALLSQTEPAFSPLIQAQIKELLDEHDRNANAELGESSKDMTNGLDDDDDDFDDDAAAQDKDFDDDWDDEL